MIPFKQFISEDITKQELDKVEKFADELFSKLNIDINFTKHFFDRLNDRRNGASITSAELISLFQKTFKRHGEKIAGLGANIEKVLNDLATQLNVPFVMKLDRKNNTIDFVAKTIMRNKNFKTPDEKLKV
jgi:hypothetical protein